MHSRKAGSTLVGLKALKETRNPDAMRIGLDACRGGNGTLSVVTPAAAGDSDSLPSEVNSCPENV